MNWRRTALCMMAACGGELVALHCYIGGVLLVALAAGLAAVTEIKL